MTEKIKSQKQIVRIANFYRKRGKKIVTFNGSFDILHFGHIRALEEAKSQGDILIILLNSDRSVASYKGPYRPIIPQDYRAKVLAALSCVDYITIFHEINPIFIVSQIKPNIHCNGSDWGRNCIERGVVESNGGRIHVLKWYKGFSTSDVISKILKKYAQPTIKAVFLDRDGTINDNRMGYTSTIKNFIFLPLVKQALNKLSKTDYKIIITTNQSGIGRGFFKVSDLLKLHAWMQKEFREQNIRLDKIYYCPHRPQDNCRCRKPKLGMLLDAVKDFRISLNDGWLIGDDDKDVVLGRSANVKTIKLGKKVAADLKLQPNFYARDLMEAVNIILKN